MTTLTLEVEEDVLERARREASRRGTSVESLAVEQVKELAGILPGLSPKKPLSVAELAKRHPLIFPDGRIPNRDERNAR